MKTLENIGCGIIIIYCIVILLLGIGWVKNLIKFIKLDFQEPYKAEIIRGISLVTPIAGVTGWINIKDN